jgi:hypothetical protein
MSSRSPKSSSPKSKSSSPKSPKSKSSSPKSQSHKLIRNQPYYVDNKYYNVLIYNAKTKKEKLIRFGGKTSPTITQKILSENEKTLLRRDKYLTEHKESNDPTTKQFWIRRYIWLSGEPYAFNKEYETEVIKNPTFPPMNAKDPIAAYPIPIANSYFYDPYYGAYNYGPSYPNPYYVPNYYPPYPADYGGDIALAGLAGLAIGGALGAASYGGYRSPRYYKGGYHASHGHYGYDGHRH